MFAIAIAEGADALLSGGTRIVASMPDARSWLCSGHPPWISDHL